MTKLESRGAARVAAAAGLGLTLALGAVPVVALADEPSALTAETGTAEDEDATETAGQRYVAQIGDSQYESLSAAIAAVPSTGVETEVVLTGDIVMSTEDIVTIAEGQNVVLDMAEHSITAAEGFDGRSIINNGTLLITGDGTIDVSASSSGLGPLDNYGVLTVESGTFRGNLNANGANVWNRAGATATFKGGHFDTNGTAIATEAGSTTTISGGYYESPWYPALENKGKATVTGGTFVNTSCSSCDDAHWGYTIRSGYSSEDAYLRIDDANVTGTQGGVSIVGGTADIYGGAFRTVDCKGQHGAVFYALYVAGESYETAATVYGGSFSSEKREAIWVGNSQGDGGNKEDATLVVKGGSFVGGDTVQSAIKVDSQLGGLGVSGGAFSSPVDAAYCAEGYKPVTTPNADGQYVVAQAKNVVKIGEQAYDSIEAALKSLESSEDKTATLVLQADVYEDVTIPDGYDVTLDLAGHTLTNESSHTISNNGTLTVADSVGGGVVDNVTHQKAAVFNAEGATTDLAAGTFRRSCEAGSGPAVNGDNSYYTILNQGTMTLGAGAVVESKLADGTYSSYSSVIANGWQSDGKPQVEGAKASLTIDGARIEGGLYVKNDRYGELEMKDGYVKGTAAGIFNYGEATISGGTVEVALEDRGAVWNYEEATYGKDAAPATLTVSGGTLNAEEDQFAIRVTNAGEDGAAIRSSITISGGQINGPIGAKDAESTVLGTDQFAITGGTYVENPVGLMDAADQSVVRINGDGTFTPVARDGKLPAGTYDVPEGAEKLTAEDFQPGLSLTTDKDGNVVATRPYTPPAVTGDAVKVEQSEGGKVSVSPSRADEGDEVTVTVAPDEGQELRGLTVVDEDGNEVEVMAGEKDGEFVFVMPDGAVTVSAVFGCDGGELCPSAGFADVDQSQWYHDAVDWAVANEILNGYGDGGELLGPLATITRAEMAQVLWNRAGRPEAEADLSGFADVDASAWYADPVAWCLSEGVFQGYGDTFGTERAISREEVATVLWRLSGSPESDSDSDSDLSSFLDASSVSEYATDALAWAVESGVVTGKDDGTKLDPQGQCTRAEVAAVLMRMGE